MIFRTSSAASSRPAKGISTSQVVKGSGSGREDAVAPGVVHDEELEEKLDGDSGKDQLVRKEPMRKRDSRDERQAKTFAIWVTMMAVRQAVVA